MRSILDNQLEAFGISSNFFYLGNQSSIEIVRVVRSVPGKRMVCQAKFLGSEVYAKFFFGKRSIIHARRDAEGIQLLQHHQILTPPLIYQGTHDCIHVLVFQAIKHASDAERVYQAGNSIDKKVLAFALVEVVAKHHCENLMQSDLHLKNFLVQDGLIYTIDGDGINHFALLSKTRALKNLSTLLSKFDVLDLQCWMNDLIALYIIKRGWSDQPSFAKIEKMVFKSREKAAHHFADIKVFRKCTDVYIEKTITLFQAFASQIKLDRSNFEPSLLDRFLDAHLSLKLGRTSTVGLLQLEHEQLVVKRYNIKSLWHAFNRAFRQTRAAASWSNAHRLKILGIPTPQPIALIEQRFFCLRGKAYFLSEYLDAPDVKAYFATLKNKKQQNATIRNIVNLFYRLHLLKLSHGDMKSSNIKMLDGTPWLIDLDSMRQHRFDYFALKAHVEDLRRFMLNWQDQSTLYNMFVKEFHIVYPDHKALRLAGLIH
jgi:tRNA A-37 threonylcarbamoyl transferase component Bud32